MSAKRRVSDAKNKCSTLWRGTSSIYYIGRKYIDSLFISLGKQAVDRCAIFPHRVVKCATAVSIVAPPPRLPVSPRLRALSSPCGFILRQKSVSLDYTPDRVIRVPFLCALCVCGGGGGGGLFIGAAGGTGVSRVTWSIVTRLLSVSIFDSSRDVR